MLITALLMVPLDTMGKIAPPGHNVQGLPLVSIQSKQAFPGRKLEYLEKSKADVRRTSTQKALRVKPGAFLLWGESADH